MEEDYLYSQKIDHQVLNGIADPIPMKELYL